MSLPRAKCYAALIAVILLALGTPAGAQKPVKGAAWNGEYSYEAQLGKTVGGHGIVISYTIQIASENSKSEAVIKAEGYQTDEEIMCRAESRGNEIRLFFNSYGNGGATNRFGVEEYKKGDLLLSLQKVPGKGGAKYLAVWGKYRIDTRKKVYFKKTA